MKTKICFDFDFNCATKKERKQYCAPSELIEIIGFYLILISVHALTIVSMVEFFSRDHSRATHLNNLQ